MLKQNNIVGKWLTQKPNFPCVFVAKKVYSGIPTWKLYKVKSCKNKLLVYNIKNEFICPLENFSADMYLVVDILTK